MTFKSLHTGRHKEQVSEMRFSPKGVAQFFLRRVSVLRMNISVESFGILFSAITFQQ